LKLIFGIPKGHNSNGITAGKGSILKSRIWLNELISSVLLQTTAVRKAELCQKSPRCQSLKEGRILFSPCVIAQFIFIGYISAL
jgi:hypothetical protein